MFSRDRLKGHRLVVSMDLSFIFMRLFVAYLKVGHPGSNTSISAAFINADRPAGTILSYGKDNSYGHPHSEVVQRLTKVGSKIYSTAESGDITFTTNGTTHSASVKPWYGTVAPKPIEPKLQPKSPSKPKPDLGSGLHVITGAPTSFQNCTTMRKHYLL